MTTFEIEDYTTVRLTNVNPRIQKHGTEGIPAVDMNFSMDAANGVLSYFDGSLLNALYRSNDELEDDPDQDELEGVEPVSSLPNLRFPKMNPVKWDAKHSGYSISIDYGLGGKSCLELDTCDVGKFVLDCKEGGTVEVRFQVQCAVGLTEKILGKLSLMIGQEVQIKLLRPEVATAPDTPLFDQKAESDKITAGDIFGEAHAPVH